MRRAARPNCHTIALSDSAADRGKTASIPAAVRSYCIPHGKDLEMLVFVYGLCRWSANFASLLVVYYRIEQISRLNLACAGALWLWISNSSGSRCSEIQTLARQASPAQSGPGCLVRARLCAHLEKTAFFSYPKRYEIDQ
jgi:hypothetical protein